MTLFASAYYRISRFAPHIIWRKTPRVHDIEPPIRPRSFSRRIFHLRSRNFRRRSARKVPPRTKPRRNFTRASNRYAPSVGSSRVSNAAQRVCSRRSPSPRTLSPREFLPFKPRAPHSGVCFAAYLCVPQTRATAKPRFAPIASRKRCRAFVFVAAARRALRSGGRVIF